MKHVFFSMHTFEKEGGSTIRMLGIMNELARQGNDVTFITNATTRKNFHPEIKFVDINYLFSRQDKRVFQFWLSFLPVWMMNMKYPGFLKRLKEIFSPFKEGSKLYFFEYLDNSIGYWLKKNGVIKGYINDLHGVATIEFLFQADLAKDVASKIKFKTKAYISKVLDKKVFNAAEGLIFASNAMQELYVNQYPAVAQKHNYIIPYVLSSGSLDPVDLKLQEELIKNLEIKSDEKVFLFAGAFKKIGGVPDLITAYKTINERNKNTRLLIIGDGPTMEECEALIKHYRLEGKAILVGRTLYNHLRTYQDMAHILVCPDKQNMYSECIIHVKYLDALASGKLVIGGAFKSVKEINANESLSLMFTPSDIESLTNTMQKSLDEYSGLKEKYSNTSAYVLEHLTYSNFIHLLNENHKENNR